jgi:hypothetical protein
MKDLPPNTVAHSLLARAGAIDPYPFPHVVIENALPEDYYWQIYNSQVYLAPEDSQNWTGNNRFTTEPHLLKERVWLDFAEYHESRAFLGDIGRTFGVRVSGNNISTARQAGNFPSPNKQKDVLGPHVDGGGIWFVGLLYMGNPEDQEGGELQLCEWIGERQWIRGNRAAEDSTRPAKTIPYRHNLFVGWINSNDAVHQVSPRKSHTYRRFVNVLIKNSKIKLGDQSVGIGSS